MRTVSRYANTVRISGSYFGTFDFPDALSLSSVPTITIRTTAMDRLDTLAARYLGNDDYWWMIAVLNKIEWAFDFRPGDLLRIPVDVNDLLKFV